MPEAERTGGPRLVEAVKIGVLAVQGAFAEHIDILRQIGVDAVPVRLPSDLEGVSGLILPGGESTTQRKLIDDWGLRQPILDLAGSGAPIFGTCAGMILLSKDITDGDEPSSRCSISRSSGTPSVASWKASNRSSTCPSSAIGRCTRSSSARRSSSVLVPTSMCLRIDDGRVVAVKQGQSSPRRFIRSLPGRRVSTVSWRRWPLNSPSPARAAGDDHIRFGAARLIDRTRRSGVVARPGARGATDRPCGAGRALAPGAWGRGRGSNGGRARACGRWGCRSGSHIGVFSLFRLPLGAFLPTTCCSSTKSRANSRSRPGRAREHARRMDDRRARRDR